MKTCELLKKIWDGGQKYPLESQLAAKAAFVANLADALGIRVFANDLDIEDIGKQCAFYMGVLSTREHVPEDKIREAHTAMVFAWSRAIVSSCLGYDKVTHLGVPASYGIA